MAIFLRLTIPQTPTLHPSPPSLFRPFQVFVTGARGGRGWTDYHATPRGVSVPPQSPWPWLVDAITAGVKSGGYVLARRFG
ncbi:hypothetical protein LZ31DRAFT_556821 [Colletotrichum somersetense]|nr:hypothetical protein LZ31DRAFT_556821 [Colletotrichum somersetense]